MALTGSEKQKRWRKRHPEKYRAKKRAEGARRYARKRAQKAAEWAALYPWMGALPSLSDVAKDLPSLEGKDWPKAKLP
jgi:hypothetical protein